ncbi:hypothetical protein [Rhodococcus koreensis]|jgi:hypothetical protein|uniref:hypothetical protein n=1 Tax=Rhodococcus koreensis TaxID=99653 RepID=UPI00197E181F|nr:hypothetical protein [Rhodococcus koreensis]QSE84998.1 hypothetical protein JWS14_41000 [Rhodococcus koreensis]
MSRRISTALATIALTLSLGALAAPMASAAPAAPAPTPVLGSVSICFSVPLGSASLVWCI